LGLAAETKERILDAAEELFSENGFAATSVRSITSRAGVNLAALNYHFGSKDAVVDAVFERRIGPLNRERLRMLDRLESEAGSAGPSLEDVLRAFLEPAIRLVTDPDRGGSKFMKLMGRGHSESSDFFRDMISKHFLEVFLRFEKVFRRILPDLPVQEFVWRMHFVVGAMAHTMAHGLSLYDLEVLRSKGSETFSRLTPEELGEMDVDSILERLIRFSAAGLRAEFPQPAEVRQC
jgi:AcrR family transcriptional regulator